MVQLDGSEARQTWKSPLVIWMEAADSKAVRNLHCISSKACPRRRLVGAGTEGRMSKPPSAQVISYGLPTMLQVECTMLVMETALMAKHTEQTCCQVMGNDTTWIVRMNRTIHTKALKRPAFVANR